MSGLLRVRGKTEEKSRREAKEIFKWQAMVVMIQSKRTKNRRSSLSLGNYKVTFKF